MKKTMEQRITVAKIPNNGFTLFCMKCNNVRLEETDNYCTNCGTELNVGMQ